MTDSTAITITQSTGVFSNIQSFEEWQRIGKALAQSTMIPQQYQGQQGFLNTLVALDIADSMRQRPIVIMQNLHFIHGRPCWSSQFIIGLINGCGQFSRLKYELTGKGDTLACTAVATELSTSEELRGPEVTMAMAKKEGWVTKNGSKWQTMPELMIRYRAATFWGRLYVPDLLMGMQTQEEVLDIEPVNVTPVQAAKPAPVVVSELNEKIQKPEVAADDELF